MANVYSVSKISSYIKGLFSQEGIFHNVQVKGEVGTLNEWNYGYIYVNLKEGEDVLPCRISPEASRRCGFKIEKGMTITVTGNIVANTGRGSYSLFASAVSRDEDLGEDLKKLLELKKELKEQGLFDPQYKLPIPEHIKVLGVITSEYGAVINDIIRVSRERDPGIQVYLYPSMVSGRGRNDAIEKGLHALVNAGCETIIVGRGGGSDEELWMYNNREIAEAVFNCPVPVISAVGHEINLTILDLVADLSVATPSQAAEKAVSDISVTKDRISYYEEAIRREFQIKLDNSRSRLKGLELELKAYSPMARLNQNKLYLSSRADRLKSLMDAIITAKRHELMVYAERMKGVSPLEKLTQGYAYVAKDGITVKDIDCVEDGDVVDIFVRDGRIEAKVTGKEKIWWENE